MWIHYSRIVNLNTQRFKTNSRIMKTSIWNLLGQFFVGTELKDRNQNRKHSET